MKNWFALAALLCSTQVLAQCRSAPAESFKDFLAKFAASKTLAMSRTIYPSYTLRHEFGLKDGVEVDAAVKTPWTRADDRARPTIKQILATNQMALEIKEVVGREAIASVYKPGTDWLLTYHFVERQGCWFLHHIEDHSL